MKKDEPIVTRRHIFQNQVCVPEGWTDEQAVAFLEADSPAGTSAGWIVDKDLGRVKCAEREGYVHLILKV